MPYHFDPLHYVGASHETDPGDLDAESRGDIQLIRVAYPEIAQWGDLAIYAAWGDTAKALELLARAVRLPDAGVVHVKTDALIDLLRSDRRFQAIERDLKFPD